MWSLVLLITKPIYKQVIKVKIKELDQGVFNKINCLVNFNATIENWSNRWNSGFLFPHNNIFKENMQMYNRAPCSD